MTCSYVHDLVIATKEQLEAARLHVTSDALQVVHDGTLSERIQLMMPKSTGEVVAWLAVETGLPARLYCAQSPLPPADTLDLFTMSVTTVSGQELGNQTQTVLVRRANGESTL
jgi:hypothetical protein